MKAQSNTRIYFALIFFALGCVLNVRAFSLLGPVQPWMQATNGVILPGDIGGPMCISNGYRWNVPVVTYGFDKSFLDYFGTNGVAAVESAIAILNDLPPASQIEPMNYPLNSQQVNYDAQAQSLYDLKSETLSALLEQMGLASPTRNVFVLRQWDPVLIYGVWYNWPDWVYPNFVALRNFDPVTFSPSYYVNNAQIGAYANTTGFENYIILFPVDPLNGGNTAVADFAQKNYSYPSYSTVLGVFFTSLTYDDVGGLAYLLSTNNIAHETLLSNVAGVGTNANAFVSGALRPGVDKITFIPQPMDLQSGTFLPTTNYFTDSYIANGVLQHQQLARVISQPDFIFSAGDAVSEWADLLFFTRTGTTNWLNNAAANGNTNGAGPGVIQPPVQIVFNKLGPLFYSGGNFSDEQALVYSWQFWGSFDGSTNQPVIYPIPQTGTNQMTVRMRLFFGTQFQKSFTWQPESLPGAQFEMQTSTNLTSWVNLFTVANDGTVYTYFNDNPSSFSAFLPADSTIKNSLF